MKEKINCESNFLFSEEPNKYFIFENCYTAQECCISDLNHNVIYI